jgi:O-antigen/teichoic acid export membrane protein
MQGGGWRKSVRFAIRRVRGDTARNTLTLVPATVVPGAVAFAGMILMGHFSSLRIVGLLSLSRVAAGFGSAILAEAPSLAIQRTLAEGQSDTSRAFRSAMLRRGMLFLPGVVGCAALLAIWNADIGWPLAWGALLTVPEAIFVFEFGYLRYTGRFNRASVLASSRSTGAWTAAVVTAGLTKSFLDVALAFLLVTLLIGMVIQPLRLGPVDTATRDHLRGTWRSLSSYNVASYALNNGDQYLLGALRGPTLVGVYSLGYTLGAGIVSLVAEPLIGILSPRIIREWENPDEGPAKATSTSLRGSLFLVFAGAFLSTAIALAGGFGLLRFVTEKASVGGVAAIVGVALTLHNTSALSFQTILYLRRKTRLMSNAAWITVILAIPAIAGLTIAFGVIGTALATLFAYTLMAAIQGFLVRRDPNGQASTARQI